MGGQTILTNSLGQKTTYRHAIVAGEFRLLEVRGAGCALCGQANVRYAYDKYEQPAPGVDHHGLLTRIIAPGNVITEVLERDLALRPTRLRSIDGDLVQLVTVVNNWRGAPVDIELSAAALHRHWHTDYNAAGQVIAMILPGNVRTAFQYDQAGQMSKTILPDGSGILTTHDTEGRTAGTARFLDPEGGIAAGLPKIHFDHDKPADQPGGLTSVGDALGLVKSYRYNDAGQVPPSPTRWASPASSTTMPPDCSPGARTPPAVWTPPA